MMDMATSISSSVKPERLWFSDCRYCMDFGLMLIMDIFINLPGLGTRQLFSIAVEMVECDTTSHYRLHPAGE